MIIVLNDNYRGSVVNQNSYSELYDRQNLNNVAPQNNRVQVQGSLYIFTL